MFNLLKHKIDSSDLIEKELFAIGVIKQRDNRWKIKVGDESLLLDSITECVEVINKGVSELKSHIRDRWNDLFHLVSVLLDEASENDSGLENILFLNNVKKAYILSLRFTELETVSDTIKKIFYIDPAKLSSESVKRFNMLYLQIQLIHHLIMCEIYRLQVINCMKKRIKVANISGPWANLDLPMKERIWEWDEGEEEYFANRQKAKRDQVRYNPETVGPYGFYYVWNDKTRDPYLFKDREEESPYPVRNLLSIP